MNKTFIRSIVDSAAGNALLAGVASRVIDGTRVLAFHQIEDRAGFLKGVDWILDRFTPISTRNIGEASARGATSPKGVCFTFDDGDPSVLSVAEELASKGVEATLFVCPGVIETGAPFWWQVVREGAKRAVVTNGVRLDQPLLEWQMKTWPDERRRGFVSAVRDQLESGGVSLAGKQLTARDLEDWIGAGHLVGNHSWDHPILDTCDPLEQRRQIEDADVWLSDHSISRVPMFAYPDGNATEVARRVLREAGYFGAFLFDHRVHRGVPGFDVSRVRVNADGRQNRFRASSSGIHPAVHALRRRIS